jgi:hypothetical protein
MATRASSAVRHSAGMLYRSRRRPMPVLVPELHRNRPARRGPRPYVRTSRTVRPLPVPVRDGSCLPCRIRHRTDAATDRWGYKRSGPRWKRWFMVGRENDSDKDRVAWGVEDGAAVCDRARLERNLSEPGAISWRVLWMWGEAWQLWVQLTERPRPRCLRVRALSHRSAAAAALLSLFFLLRSASLARTAAFNQESLV